MRAQFSGSAVANLFPYCAYLGRIDIYLRTYTTTYAPLKAGWTWNPNSLVPMDFDGWQVGVNTPIPTGFHARLIDLETGYTDLTVGTLTGVRNQNWPPLCWKDDYLTGWYTGTSNITSYTCSYYMPYSGQAETIGALNMSGGISVPSQANTQIPGLNCEPNWVLADGSIFGSSVVSLENFYSKFRGYAGGPKIDTYDEALSGCHFVSVTGVLNCMVPYNGANYCWTKNLSGGNVTYNVIQTDFQTFANYLLMTMQNPAQSTLDFNAKFRSSLASGDTEATLFGFLAIYNDTITVDGVTMAGYAVLFLPDLSGWYLLNMIGIDDNAVNWSNHLGNPQAIFDRSGAIWIKNANMDSTLWVGTRQYPGATAIPPGLKPQTPPLNLPVNPGLYR